MKIKDANGVDWNVAVAGEEGSEAVVLLVHGFPLDHQMWKHQLSDLSKHARIIAPDLPLFGGSRFPPGRDEPASIEGWADDLAALLDALSVDRPVIFCGLSMGGYIGWQFWRRHAKRMRGLVCCDTRSAADAPEVARGREMMAARVRNEGAGFVSGAMIPKLFATKAVEQEVAAVVETKSVVERTDPEAIAQGQLAMACRVDATDWLSEVRLPTLVVVGSEDVITPPQEMAAMAEQIANAEYFEIEGAGHMAPLEKPGVFNARVKDFLAQW